MAIKKQTPCVNDTVLVLAEQATNGDVLVYANDEYQWTPRSEAWADLTMLTKTERGFEFIDKNGRSRGIVNLGEPYHGIDPTPSCKGCAKDYVYQNAVSCLQALCCGQTAYVGTCNAVGEGWSVDWCDLPSDTPIPPEEIDQFTNNMTVRALTAEELRANPAIYDSMLSALGMPNPAFRDKTLEDTLNSTQFLVDGVTSATVGDILAYNPQDSKYDWMPVFVVFEDFASLQSAVQNSQIPPDVVIFKLKTHQYEVSGTDFEEIAHGDMEVTASMVDMIVQSGVMINRNMYLPLTMHTNVGHVDADVTEIGAPYLGALMQVKHYPMSQAEADVLSQMANFKHTAKALQRKMVYGQAQSTFTNVEPFPYGAFVDKTL